MCFSDKPSTTPPPPPSRCCPFFTGAFVQSVPSSIYLEKATNDDELSVISWVEEGAWTFNNNYLKAFQVHYPHLFRAFKLLGTVPICD